MNLPVAVGPGTEHQTCGATLAPTGTATSSLALMTESKQADVYLKLPTQICTVHTKTLIYLQIYFQKHEPSNSIFNFEKITTQIKDGKIF